VAQRNDQVFQLSLTEIAFTISFILLILLGSLVFQEQRARKEAELNLAQAGQLDQLKESFNEAKNALSASISGAGVANPDEVISRLVAAEEARAERDRLKTVVEDLDAQLTALAEVKALVEKAGEDADVKVAKDAVVSALAQQVQLRKLLDDASILGAVPLESERAERAQGDLARIGEAIRTVDELKKGLKTELGRELVPGQEAKAVQEVVKAARSYGELTKGGANPLSIGKENSDLRGQVAFLKNRLDARGGRDYPPCWADESGKVEFLFAIELQSDSIAVLPAWPARRQSDAQLLPGVSEILAGPLTHVGFAARMKGILDWSKRQDPQCRHYVQLKSSISDAVRSDRARLMVENHFYKVEARR
jgi:hypothetical protein